MRASLRRRLRLARRGLGMAVAGALVLVALVIGVANQLLPWAERHPDRVAAWLGERIGRPIAFTSVQTEWTRRGPLLQLDGLRIGAADGSAGTIAVGDAEMLVSLYAGLLPDTPFSELRLRGLDLTLERDDAGRWTVRGLPGDQAAGVIRSPRWRDWANCRSSAGGSRSTRPGSGCMRDCRASTCACGWAAPASAPACAPGRVRVPRRWMSRSTSIARRATEGCTHAPRPPTWRPGRTGCSSAASWSSPAVGGWRPGRHCATTASTR